MTMLVGLYDVYTGQSSTALSLLQWYASVSGVGYMRQARRSTGTPTSPS